MTYKIDVIIARNVTGTDIFLPEFGVSVPANGELVLSDFLFGHEIRNGYILREKVISGDISLSDGQNDLGFLILGFSDSSSILQMPIDTSIPFFDGCVLSYRDGYWKPHKEVGERTLLFDAVDSSGGTSIDSGFTDVPLTVRNNDSEAFSHSGSSSEVTILQSGMYCITYNVGTKIVSGRMRSESEARLMADIGGMGFAEVPNTLTSMYNRTKNQGRNSCSRSLSLFLQPGDKLKVQARKVSGSSLIALDAGTSSLTIFLPKGLKGDKGEKGEKGDAGGSGSMEIQSDGISLQNGPHSILNIANGLNAEDAGEGVAILSAEDPQPGPPDLSLSSYEFQDFHGKYLPPNWVPNVLGNGSYVKPVLGGIGGQVELATGKGSLRIVKEKNDAALSNSAASLGLLGGAFTVSSKMNLLVRARLMEISKIHIRIGFQDEKLFNESCFFVDNLNSSKWIARTRKSGIHTDTLIDMEADTFWHMFEIMSNGSLIKFKIDGEIVAEHSTNIPNGYMYPSAYIESKEWQMKRLRIDYFQITSDREE